MLFVLSCDKKVAKIDASAPFTAEQCDTVTFSKHIGPLVQTNCALSGCHATGEPQINLTSYAAVKTIADDGRMRSYVIEGNPEFMPKGGQLSQRDKNFVICWLDNGKKP